MTSQPSDGLDRYRLLGPSGLRVSPLTLGTMTFGTEWGWGSDKSESRRVLDLYLDKGGNSIDTANFYTGGTSESLLGEFLAGRRDQVVLATKYTLNMRPGDPNAGGNHRKNLKQSVEASLKRLNTDYIDLLWVHAWESRTPVEEMLRSLDDLVRAGKILYVGISNAPAWKISEANVIAALSGWTPFIALQMQYNLLERAVEREIAPMAEEFGLGMMPWSPLGAGVLTGKYNRGAEQATGMQQSLRRERQEKGVTERSLKIAESVEEIGKQIDRSAAQVAVNWLLQKASVVSPIIGARTPEQLEDNLRCLEFELSDEKLAHLDEVSEIDLGYPHNFLGGAMVREFLDGGADIET